jgi:DNA-directed RNA polymerase subunit L
MKNEDYTLGNALVYFIYQKYFLGTKSVSFVGFRVPHPHIPNGIIRIAFDNDNDDSTTVSQYLTFAAESVITTFTNIQSNFKD